MEPRAHHVLIGLFTVIVAGAALLFALWLGKSYKDVELRHYTVIFSESVQGLSRGSAVQYSGIKVGDVTDLSLDPQDPGKIRARIRVDGTIPIQQDTRAKLVLTGITGTTVIELSGGTPTSPPLLAKDGEDPVIVATPSAINRLLANSDNLMLNITELVMNAKTILSPDTAQRLDNTLESLVRAADAIADQKEDFSVLLQSLTAASRQTTATLQQTSSLVRTTDVLVKNQGVRAFDSAQQAMSSLEKVSADISEIVHTNKGAINSGLQGLGEIGPVLQELHRTLASMRTLIRRLEENPANYLLGREKIQEFQP